MNKDKKSKDIIKVLEHADNLKHFIGFGKIPIYVLQSEEFLSLAFNFLSKLNEFCEDCSMECEDDFCKSLNNVRASLAELSFAHAKYKLSKFDKKD